MAREMIVLPYDSKWEDEYKRIRDTLIIIFGGIALDIQHFGSTSVIGMSAKPIIDFMVIVNNIQEVDNLNSKMVNAGYIPLGENGIVGRRYFQHFNIDGINHDQHIHCYEKNNEHVINEIMFRDYLRIDGEAFNQYLNVKIKASQKYKYSPSEYTEYKSECVNCIMAKARLYFEKKNDYSSRE